MTVKELKEALRIYPDDMEVVVSDTFCGEMDGYTTPQLDRLRLFKDNGYWRYTVRPYLGQEVLYITH